MRNMYESVSRTQRVVLFAVFGLLLSLSMLAMSPAQAYAADVTVNGSTATVYSATGLKSAVANQAVDRIEFANDIAVTDPRLKTMDIAAKRTNSKLTIDGMGHTFTEWYVSGFDCGAGLRLKSTGNLNYISVQNMNIIGGNGYGTIFTEAKGVTQAFENVTYNGPQMVYNPKGSLSLTNCDITLNFAQGKGSYLGELAEVMNVDLAGSVNIVRKAGSCDEIFWLKCGGNRIAFADGAKVTATNEQPSNKGKSGFIWSDADYDFIVGNNVSFVYNGSNVFEETCKMQNFTVGTGSIVDININSDLKCTPIHAKKNITVGQDSTVTIDVAGQTCSEVFVSKYDMNILDRATVAINIAGKNGCDVVKSDCKDIILANSANLSVNVGGEVCGKVFYVPCGSITIGANSNMTAISNGKLHCPLMKICKNLYVGERAVLDLIGQNNVNKGCCTYAFVANGCGTMTYDKPERVLFYNGCTDTSCSKAACLGCNMTFDFDITSTRYWKNSNTTGGPTVLQNEDYNWSQGSWYQINAFAKDCCQFRTFDVQNYVNGTINPKEYYFGTKAYQVCLWEGEEKYNVTYVVNEKSSEAFNPPVVKTIVGQNTTEAIANPFFTGWEFVGWSTYQDVAQAEAAGFILPGQTLTLTDDVTYYAHWKSKTPILSTVYVNSDRISGSNSADGATVSLKYLTDSTTKVAAGPTWYVDAPFGSEPLKPGEIVYAFQTELNKLPSNQAQTTILNR